MTETPESEEGADLHAVGERIELLLDRLERALGAGFADVEELVRLLSDLYGTGLRRAVDIAGPEYLRQLADDELVGSLLLVHGAHPDRLEARAEAAVASVLPGAEARGARVEVVAVSEAARTVHLNVVAHNPEGVGAYVARAVEAALPDATVTVNLQESGTPIRLGRKPAGISS
ncbi:MAG: hypothetical protein NVSMB12_11600 [Acidimicrobiales bacterium]